MITTNYMITALGGEFGEEFGEVDGGAVDGGAVG